MARLVASPVHYPDFQTVLPPTSGEAFPLTRATHHQYHHRLSLRCSHRYLREPLQVGYQYSPHLFFSLFPYSQDLVRNQLPRTAERLIVNVQLVIVAFVSKQLFETQPAFAHQSIALLSGRYCVFQVGLSLTL